MKTPKPKITVGRYTSGKKYWLVSCMLPGGRHRKKHDSELAANQDRVRIIRESASTLTREDHADAERAIHELKNSDNADARRCSLLKAVQWFCVHYVDELKVKAIGEYYEDFLAIKNAQGRRSDTIREIEKILGKFARDFAQADVTTLRYSAIKPWVIKNSDGPRSYERVHHMVKHFFGYLSGQSKNTPNPCPILKESPFKGRGVVYQDDEADDCTKITIFTATECEALLREAQKFNAQRMFLWLLLTGMRPKESIRFWTNPKWGWKLVSDDLNYISVPKAISKTRQNRVIEVHPTLKLWLEIYRHHPSFMTPNWRYKYTWVRQNVLTDDKMDADVARHTLISMMIKEGKGWAEIEMQMGNKKDVQMRHYASLISSKDEVDAFYAMNPTKFDHDLLETKKREQIRAQLKEQMLINRAKGYLPKSQVVL